jgi:hypothetical protein
MAYSPNEDKQGDIRRALMGAEGRTTHRRLVPARQIAHQKHLELHSRNVFETLWDPKTPDVNTTSSTGDHDDALYDSALGAEKPLLGDRHSPPTSTPGLKKIKIDHSISGSSGSTVGRHYYNDEDDVFKDFGPDPGSANSQSSFPPSPPHSRPQRSSGRWISAAHPWWPKTFERIHWTPLLTLAIVVLVAYPLLWLASVIGAENPSFGHGSLSVAFRRC